MEASVYGGANPLLVHGPLRVSANRRHFEHADGTPFFWLGDTWWLGFTRQMRWPEDFQFLAADRAAKGFSVIQIVAGLYPEMPWPDERGMNEAGYPWDKDFTRINPAYFDMADLRVQWLVHVGLVPCIVACWGYFLPWLGVNKMKKHWRYLVARWGSCPVVWCLAGESAMPFYGLKFGDQAAKKQAEENKAFQITGWTELGRYLRSVDPFRRPVTIHPGGSGDCGRDMILDDSVLDFDMLQTGHSGYDSIPNTFKRVSEEYARQPHMPVINGECCYEGILEGSRQEIQRFMFYACLLSGAAGHTYGANGIWQLNRREQPYGPSPSGINWGNVPWDQACHLPGSAHVGVAKRLLERYNWWQFQPHPEWVAPHAEKDNCRAPYAAGISAQVRFIYLPGPVVPWWPSHTAKVTNLEAGVSYKACFLDPITGREYALGAVCPTADKDWPIPLTPIIQDWVLVLERQ